MGSGSRINLIRLMRGSIGFGIGIDRFPFRYTISINFLFWCLEIGIGKAYDE